MPRLPARREPQRGARLVEAYVHHGRIGVLVELETDDDFTVRTREVRELGRDLAIHIAALAPVGITPVSLRDLSRGWPVDPGADGQPETLLTQPFVRDDRITVAERIRVTEKALGASIRVRRFVRFATDDD